MRKNQDVYVQPLFSHPDNFSVRNAIVAQVQKEDLKRWALSSDEEPVIVPPVPEARPIHAVSLLFMLKACLP